VAAERTRTSRPGLFAFNVFAVSRADLERLTKLQRAYLREMRTIIAQSESSEVVALANMQISPRASRAKWLRWPTCKFARWRIERGRVGPDAIG